MEANLENYPTPRGKAAKRSVQCRSHGDKAPKRLKENELTACTQRLRLSIEGNAINSDAKISPYNLDLNSAFNSPQAVSKTVNQTCGYVRINDQGQEVTSSLSSLHRECSSKLDPPLLGLPPSFTLDLLAESDTVSVMTPPQKKKRRKMPRRPVTAPTYLLMSDRAPKLDIYDPDDSTANRQQALQAFEKFIKNEQKKTYILTEHNK